MSTTTRSPKSTKPSAIQVLKEDHRQVEDLFAQFEKLGPKAAKARESIVKKVIEALSAHAAIEEQVFYPAVREQIDAADDTVLEALEEHHIVKWTLSELDGMSPTDERYDAKMTVLMEMVRHHVEEEEGEMFPQVREAMTRSQLEELGNALVLAKKGAPKRPHPRTPDTPPGNLVAGAVTAPMDAARAAGEAAVRKVRDLASRR